MVMITIIVITLATVGLLPVWGAYPAAFLALLVTLLSALRLLRFPASFEIAPSALTIAGDPILWSRVSEVVCDSNEMALSVLLHQGEPVVMRCDPVRHAPEDLQWLADRIVEQFAAVAQSPDP